MAFWTTETLERRAPGELLIRPFRRERIKHGAYQLSLGEEVVITPKAKQSTLFAYNRHAVIPPGQFALLLTEEIVSVPNDAIGLISIRAGIKFKGLINVSGFHVDPGYCGRLKFSVYNAGSSDIVVGSGEQIFLLWYVSLDGRTQDLYSNDDSHNTIRPQDVERMRGDVPSPNALAQRISKVEMQVKGTWAVLLLIVGGAVSALFALLLKP